MRRFARILIAVSATASAQDGGTASAAAGGVDVAGLAVELDGLYTHRDEGEFARKNEEAIGAALNAAPEEYEILWRAARWYFWAADGEDGKAKQKLGKRGWELGDQAAAREPKRAEGHYYAAIAVGSYSQGVGIFNALLGGMEGKFLDRLNKALELNPGIDNQGPAISMGRYHYELPWPKYNGKKSIEWLNKALAKQPKSARAHLYLAETLLKEDQPKEALAQVDEALSIAPGTLDAPEERRVHALAKVLKPRIEKELQ